jgi:hypothetical protein
VNYRPVLTVRAAAQFADLSRQQEIYEAFMDRLLQLVGAPWDARLVQPGGGEPEFRETLFGEAAERALAGRCAGRFDVNALVQAIAVGVSPFRSWPPLSRYLGGLHGRAGDGTRGRRVADRLR